MTLDERTDLAMQTRVSPFWTKREIALALIQAAFPDLFGSPPTAWIAPIHLTEEMIAAGTESVKHTDPDYEDYEDKDGVESLIHNEVILSYAAMRDSHLSTLKGEK